MDEVAVRERALMLCDALVAGDVGAATRDFSAELRSNLGEVIALLPLPASAAAIESVVQAHSGFTSVIRIVGDGQEVMLQLRWKDRDGQVTVVEVSHLSQSATAPAEPEGEGEGQEAPEAAG